ncbi:MAG: CesT family type III secretion system chaperone [Verrucomicrobiota bacterium]|jgi:hypothetical protein
MTVRDSLQQFLDALGAQTGARFALDARGAACIRFNDTVEIVAEAQEQLGLFFLHAPVCSLEPAGRVEVIEHAFSLALFGLGTGGCVIGYDRPGDRLVLSASRPCGRMDAADFINLFGHFLEVVVRLKPALAEVQRRFSAPKATSAPSAEAGAEAGMVRV